MEEERGLVHGRLSRLAVGHGYPFRVLLRPEPEPLYPPKPGDVHVRVSLRLLATTEGGRERGIAVGYRSCWAFDPNRSVDGEMHDAPIADMHPPSIAPGETAVATIRPIAPQYWRGVSVGFQLEMREGPRTIGSAVVIAAPRTAGAG